MVREIVSVQVGQCGNQIGRRFWIELLREAVARNGADVAAASFFLSSRCRHSAGLRLHAGNTMSCLRARALLIDTEQRVLLETSRDPIVGELFGETQMIADVSGAGNNWAQGYAVYGPKHQARVEEAARAALEACDSPQAFLCMHSVGGGTGSGLGSFVLELLRDNFPELCRLSVAIYPSATDEDVITAPYNAVLATQRLAQASDCIVPLENGAMLNLCARQSHHRSYKTGFDEINDVAAQLISHLTAGSRYNGGLNIDVNEISTNLVPFPSLKYLTAGFAPLLARNWEAAHSTRNHVEPNTRIFLDACSNSSKLIECFGKKNVTTLACALFARGNIGLADICPEALRLRSQFMLPRWNPDGFKVGLCSIPPLRTPKAVLCLENSTGIAQNFLNLKIRCSKLFRARAMLHHYTQLIEADIMRSALDDLDVLIGNYTAACATP